MKGLWCNDLKCIYPKQGECTAAKVVRINGQCVTRCCKDDINGLMTKFKGGRKDNRISGVLK